jgi:hypothetical protein
MPSGNLLGSIIVPAAGSQNNKNTAVPFTIPFGCKALIMVIDGEASGYSFRTGTGSGLAALSTDLNQVGPSTIQIPLVQGSGVEQVLAVYNGGAGGTVRVLQSDGSGNLQS